MAFIPKQVTQYQAEHLDELQGDVSQQAIKFSLGLIGPFSKGDQIHDNACGSGAVTETIMALPPPEVSIYATDINEQFVQGVAALSEQKRWPVTTPTCRHRSWSSLTRSLRIHSQASLFTASATTTPPQRKSTYRTLKPGGTAIASIWISMPSVTHPLPRVPDVHV